MSSGGAGKARATAPVAPLPASGHGVWAHLQKVARVVPDGAVRLIEGLCVGEHQPNVCCKGRHGTILSFVRSGTNHTQRNGAFDNIVVQRQSSLGRKTQEKVTPAGKQAAPVIPCESFHVPAIWWRFGGANPVSFGRATVTDRVAPFLSRLVRMASRHAAICAFKRALAMIVCATWLCNASASVHGCLMQPDSTHGVHFHWISGSCRATKEEQNGRMERHSSIWLHMTSCVSDVRGNVASKAVDRRGCTSNQRAQTRMLGSVANGDRRYKAESINVSAVRL